MADWEEELNVYYLMLQVWWNSASPYTFPSDLSPHSAFYLPSFPAKQCTSLNIESMY